MFVVTYKFEHPTDASTLPPVTHEMTEFRQAFLGWASRNGLMTVTSDKKDPKCNIYKSYWKTKEDFEAFEEHFGQPYKDYTSAVLRNTEAAGGTVTRTEEIKE